jgi:hypothetical protein
MQARHDGALKGEYIRNFTFCMKDGRPVIGVGLYTIKGIIEICMHTHKFRSSDMFLNFLKEELTAMGIQESFPDLGQTSLFFSYERADGEILALLSQIGACISRIESLMKAIYDRVAERKENEEEG